MQAAAGQRQYVTAAMTVALAGAMTVAPIAPQLPEIPIVRQATRLVAGESILNIPFNLFQDLVNIPNTEMEAADLLARSLLYSGPWFTASATNIWGEDPGDPGHFMGVVDMLFPFKEISGLGDPFIDPEAAANGTLGLSQQIAMFMNAEIPVSASSDADWSAPFIPVTPITGLTGIDRTIWSIAALTGVQNYPLFDNWFKVPFSDLTSGDFQFGDVVNPSDGVGPGGSVPDDFGMVGTIPGVDADGNPVNLMPWSGMDFKLDLLAPFQNWFNSLMEPVDADSYLSGFDIPTFEELGRTLQTLSAASVVAFDPWVPGSPLCMPTCNLPEALTQPGLVQAISSMWPGNDTVDHWLDLVNTPTDGPDGLPLPWGAANGPTQSAINFATMFQTGLQTWFDFGNPSPADPPDGLDTPISFPISDEMQNLIDFMQDSGIQGLVQQWADFAGFEPIDFTDPGWLTDYTPPVDVFAGMLDATPPVDWFAEMLGDLGLSGLSGLL